MVYFGGKPSRGCLRCREKKIKCDQTPGGCGNCQRKSFKCLGYRSELDLKFRDETPYVTQKSMDRRKNRKSSSRPHASSSSKHENHRILTEALERGQNQNEDLEKGVLLPWGQRERRKLAPFWVLAGIRSRDFDNQALAFFFSNQVVDEWRGPYGTNTASYGIDDALFCAIKAAGLAGVSGFIRDPEMKIAARQRYVTAIQHVNKAIVDPENAKTDSTLTAIMLLSQVEALDCATPRPLAAWENHVKGAAAILKLRGPQKLRTPLEIRLFVQALTSILTCCLKNHIHVPDHLFHLADAAEPYMNRNTPGWRFLRVNMLHAQLVANVYHKVVTDPESIIREALALDAQACSVFDGGGPGWQFDTILDNTHPDTVPLGYYYHYQSFMSAQVWCGTRGIRLGLHNIIRKLLLAGFSAKPPVFASEKHTAQFQVSTDTLYRMQSELLASIPQYLLAPQSNKNSKLRFPWTNFPPALYNPSAMTLPTSGSIPLTRSVGGLVHLWTLYKVADLDVSTRETREMAVKLLRLSGSEMGIQQAFVLAEELELNYGK